MSSLKQSRIRKISLCKVIATLSILICACTSAIAQQNQSLSLVANKVATLIDVPEAPARAIDVVKAAFDEQALSVNATTQTWKGSGLRNGKYIGYIDHYSLNEQHPTYIYSQPYATLYLHIAAKTRDAVDITRLDKIYRQRLGIENRFANTDMLRGERAVSWARSPDFLSNIQQLAGQRVTYIIADKDMLDEFNKLLLAKGEQALYISSKPIYSVNMSLAINASHREATALIGQFNSGVDRLKQSGELTSIFSPSPDASSLLDESLFSDIIRKW